MEILVERKYKKENYTIGKLYINGEYFCDTLEDKDRGLNQDMALAELQELKEYGKTAIPTGRYKIEITWSNLFKKMLPILIDVPAYRYIRIHSGNTHKDTEGCILLGFNLAVGKVLNSRKTMAEFMSILEPIYAAGEEIWITIQ